MMKKIDVLWLIEHTAREMDVACAVKSVAQSRYGIDITVRNIYLHASQILKEYIPSIVVFPFLYRITDMAIEDYVEAWPEATFFNLAFEEIHYKAHLKMKAPGDEFTRQRVIHHAWGNFYKNYLLESGVPLDHIFVNGNPVYQLYKYPYHEYFKQRDQLAEQYGIDPLKRWVFIPENYKWAFFSDDKLQRSANRGGDMEEHLNMRAFCRESLGHLLRWCNEAGGNGELEIIFRPRPATNSQQVEAFFEEHVGAPTEHLHFTKAESVREWIMASDVVISSYSTSLIEAAVAGKPAYMAEPLPIPDSLSCDWYKFVPRIRSVAEFEEACQSVTEEHKHELQTWAEEEMLSHGDPILGLADLIGNLAKKNRASNTGRLVFVLLKVRWNLRYRQLVKYSRLALKSLVSAANILLLDVAVALKLRVAGSEMRSEGTVLTRLFAQVSDAVNLFSLGFKDRDHFSLITHENDVFTEAEVLDRAEKWREVLANG